MGMVASDFQHRAVAATRQRRGRVPRGFTLVELLVVLAILSLLVALAAPRVIKYLSTALYGQTASGTGLSAIGMRSK